jgi:hypothetical protein
MKTIYVSFKTEVRKIEAPDHWLAHDITTYLKITYNNLWKEWSYLPLKPNKK